MLPAVAEKWLAAGAVAWLFVVRRIDAVTLAPFLVDVVLGALFLVSCPRTAGTPSDAA